MDQEDKQNIRLLLAGLAHGRQRVEAGEQIDAFDIGGCGCFA